MALILKLFAVLALAAAASAQQPVYCPVFGTYPTTNWYVQPNVDLSVQTTYAGQVYYSPNMNCIISIKADRAGRILVRVVQSDLASYSARISIRTDIISGSLASWNRLTYNVNWHGSFVSLTNSLYISFQTTSDLPGPSQGVQLRLTFLPADGCLPGWAPTQLAGQKHCVGRPTITPFQFGDAQDFCKRWRSNLLVSDRDNISTALAQVDANSAWIGMTAEPSGSVSYYRWISNAPVNPSVAVECFSPCVPGSTKHRCVQSQARSRLVQTECSTALPPICFMPAGGTDSFYKSSATVRASGALLASAAVLVWSLLG